MRPSVKPAPAPQLTTAAIRKAERPALGRPLRLVAMVATMVAALTTPAVQAHPELTPARVNRYLTLTPRGNQMQLRLLLLFGAEPAGVRRLALDADRNGTIDDAEIATESSAWRARGHESLRLLVDGTVTAVALQAKIDLGTDRGTGAKPFVIELTGRVALPFGERRIALEVGPDLPSMGETEISLDAGEPWSLIATLDAAGTRHAPQPLVSYPVARRSPEEARAASYLIRPTGAAVVPSGFPIVPTILVLLSLLLGAALMRFVRPKKR